MIPAWSGRTFLIPAFAMKPTGDPRVHRANATSLGDLFSKHGLSPRSRGGLFVMGVTAHERRMIPGSIGRIKWITHDYLRPN